MNDYDELIELIGTSTIKEINRLFRGDNKLLAMQLIKLTQDFKPYWPMTVRAFYYQAVARLLIANKYSKYRTVSRVLATLRREELVSWRAVEDKTRSTSNKRGLPDVNAFIEMQLEGFLHPQYYQRCYIQEQDIYVELSVEKDALSTFVKDAAWMHCTRVSVMRGQTSATALNEMAERFDKAIMLGKEPILLHLGDLDPTGVQIPKSIQAGLYKHHGIDVDVRQIGLTPEQCIKYNLPQSIDPPKAEDPNIKRWYEEYGDQSPTELDALHPEKLKQLVENSLNDVYNIDEMDEQRIKEKAERDLLWEMRAEVFEFMENNYPDELKNVSYE